MPSVDVVRMGSAGAPGSGLSLRGLLRAQPEATRARLVARRGLELDPHKQLDATEQAARGLATLPRTLVESLGSSAREALESLTPRPGWRARSALGGGALALVEAGLAFAYPAEEDALAVPGVYRLQLPTPRAEHRHAARALLAALDTETRDDVSLAQHGRRVTTGWPLALEPVLLRLESAPELDRFLATLDREGLLALSAIEARGGEVTLDAFLDLARETARWSGSRVPRRGLAFQLVSSALVLPDGEGRMVMPLEVQERVGRERRELLVRRRSAAIDETATREDEPQRAVLGTPPGMRALAVWLEAGASSTPQGRVAISRAARRSGTPFDATLLLVTLLEATPLRSAKLGAISSAILETWRGGHAWDELLETPRVPTGTSLETPSVVLRACVLDGLASLPRGRFAERAVVQGAIESDLRFDGVRTAFERGRTRRGADWVDELSVAIDRLLDVSLPALGLVDVAPDGSLRLASWARDREEHAASAPQATARAERATRWEEGDRVRVGPSTLVADVVPLALVADVVAEEGGLVLALDPSRATLERRDTVLAALGRLGHPDLEAFAARCPRPRGEGIAVRSSFAISVEPPELAAELRADAELRRWLVSPHPEGPFLVLAEQAPRGPLLRALARLGLSVELPRGVTPSRDKRRSRPARTNRTNRS